jgi:hypothetical protein
MWLAKFAEGLMIIHQRLFKAGPVASGGTIDAMRCKSPQFRLPIPSGRAHRPKTIGAAVLALLAALFAAYTQYKPQSSTSQDASPPSERRTERSRPVPGDTIDRSGSIIDDGGIGKLYREKRSDVVVEAGAVVGRLLPDDTETSDGSSRHQRFIARLPTGATVLVAHNIDLASRVPLREGDNIRFRGEYEWTDRGGVVHWTHADKRNGRAVGWIEHNGKRYE